MFMKINLKQAAWVLAIAGAMSTAAFAADREIKVETGWMLRPTR